MHCKYHLSNGWQIRITLQLHLANIRLITGLMSPYSPCYRLLTSGLTSVMIRIFLFSSYYVLICYFWWILVSSVRRIFRNRRKVRMFPQKLFPLNMVRSNWMEMIFEAWNAIDFTPNGMSNEHWSSMKKEFIIMCYSMSDRYL